MEANTNFNMQDLADDVSIITVTEPFDLSDPNVQPINMFLATDDAIPPNTVCNSTGWGLTSGGSLFPPNALQWVQIPTHDAEECEQIFGDVITDGMICAGGPGSGACNVSMLLIGSSDGSVNSSSRKIHTRKQCLAFHRITFHVIF